MTEEAWEVVEEAFGLPQAELIRSLLEAEGIEVVMSQEGIGHAMGLTVGPAAKVDVLVPANKVELARKILDEYFEDQAPGEDEAEPETSEDQ
jgi:hypothetical protein